jgi:hypothetical protein
LRFSPILAHPKLDTLRDIPLAIYRDICLNDDIVVHALAICVVICYADGKNPDMWGYRRSMGCVRLCRSGSFAYSSAHGAGA